jgi:hypothetical protein
MNMDTCDNTKAEDSDGLLDALRRKHEDSSWFKVICSPPHCEDRTIKDGMTWDDARELAERLYRRHVERHGHKRLTSWTRRLYSAVYSRKR